MLLHCLSSAGRDVAEEVEDEGGREGGGFLLVHHGLIGGATGRTSVGEGSTRGTAKRGDREGTTSRATRRGCSGHAHGASWSAMCDLQG